MALHDIVQHLGDQRVDCKADTSSHAYLHHPGNAAREEAQRAFILQHLHEAVHGAFVQLLRFLALHLRLHAVLRLRKHHAGHARQQPSRAVVEARLIQLLVAARQLRKTFAAVACAQPDSYPVLKSLATRHGTAQLVPPDA